MVKKKKSDKKKIERRDIGIETEKEEKEKRDIAIVTEEEIVVEKIDEKREKRERNTRDRSRDQKEI